MPANASREVAAGGTSGRFSTFGGVFTPCTLTILGVIMFLRFGQVVGNAGLWQALLILFAAKAITTITALALSAIATNTRVRGGGAYYIISRSLGVEFGGAIGIVFFLSQAVSVALYVIGFTEALLATFPALTADSRLIGSVVNLLVFICVYIGAGWTIKVQYAILAVLALSILSFAIGAGQAWDTDRLLVNSGPGYLDDESIWTMFALFFPAATGIMAGANMSGDLKEPARSIPRGTLLSILVTALVYAAFAVLLAAGAPRGDLQSNNMIVSDLAFWSPLIAAGVFAATLSSALGSMMGAPRILQALARDQVFKPLKPFAAGSGSNGEPRRATILSFVIAEVGIVFGDLNAIAPIITMFFMITYGALNLATFSEAFSGNPSYRPTFKACPPMLALLGAVLCGGAMVLIDPLWAVVAIAVMAVVHRYLARQEIEAGFGDVQSGAAFERARRNLLTLEHERYHPKNWRPAILAMGAHKEDRLHIAVYSRWLSGPHGLLVLGQVIIGEHEDVLDRHGRAQRQIRKFIDAQDLHAFPGVAIAPTRVNGISSLVQCCGIGALRPNLIMFGWSEDVERRQEFLESLRLVTRLERSLAILRVAEHARGVEHSPHGSIDVWWLGMANGGLMLLLAHVLRQNPGWRGRSIRLLRMLPGEAGKEETLRHLQELASKARIPVDCRVVAGDRFGEVLERESGRAALVVLGFADPNEQDDQMLDRLDDITRQLPRVLLVHSVGDMSLDE